MPFLASGGTRDTGIHHNDENKRKGFRLCVFAVHVVLVFLMNGCLCYRLHDIQA